MLTLLRAADLHAPTPVGVVDVLVAGDRVVHVGTAEDVLGAGARVTTVDLDGRTVVPGLVDAHVHVTGGGGEAGPASSVPPLPLTACTTAGTTTVVGLLGTDDEVRTTASLLARVRALRQQGLSAWAWTGGYHLPPTTLTGSVRGDVVHLDPVIGVGEVAISDHRSSQPTLDDLLRVAAEAHVGGLLAGKAGVVHLHVGDGPRGLELVREALAVSELPASVWHPTHVNRRTALFEEALDLTRAGVTVDVTAFPVADGEDALDAPAAVAVFLDAGLPVERLTVSSDAGGSLPEFDADGRVTRVGVGQPRALVEALAALVADGRALGDVLPAFTSSPARHLRLPDVGTVAAGSRADLVVLGDDDLPTDVLAGGTWHLRDGAPALPTSTDSPAPELEP
ncbi:MAG: beta-aspartyl-peptidase [Actinomycetes bacterium]